MKDVVMEGDSDGDGMEMEMSARVQRWHYIIPSLGLGISIAKHGLISFLVHRSSVLDEIQFVETYNIMMVRCYESTV